MSKKVITFYIVVALVVMGKVATTLYERSSNLHYGQKFATMQKRKSELLSNKQQITQKLAQKTALTDIQHSAGAAGFTAIDHPLVITSQQLASTDL